MAGTSPMTLLVWQLTTQEVLLRTACCQNRHGTAFFHSFMETEIGSSHPSRARKTQQPTALGVRLGIFLCSPPFSEEIEGFKSTQMVNGQTKRGAGIQQRTGHQTNGSRGISSPLLSHALFHRDATSTKVMFTYIPHQHLSFIRLRKCGSPCFMLLLSLLFSPQKKHRYNTILKHMVLSMQVSFWLPSDMYLLVHLLSMPLRRI